MNPKKRRPVIRPDLSPLLYTLFFLIFSHSAAGATEDRIKTLYKPYAELLDKFLIERSAADGEGLVSAFDYRAALEDPETEQLLGKQKGFLETFEIKSLDSKERAVSFWINAYNFFMLAHILENPKPDGELIDSVRDYGNLLNPYKVFKQKLFNIGGERYSLDEIEKEILLGDAYARKGWKDARIHFAVNCASVGCPPLRAILYLPNNLDTLLTENTRLALQTPRHMRIEGNTIYLSQLFEWYKNDYVEAAGSVREFIKQYTPADRHPEIEAAQSIRYIDYDWALNRPAHFPEISRTTAREHDETQG